ncbi:MBL fold metallo-hydrolase, partial [Acinetobacter baumannii]
HLELNPVNKLRSLTLLEKTFAEDNEKRLINLKKLQHLAQHEPTIEIICAHDPHELRRYQT